MTKEKYLIECVRCGKMIGPFDSLEEAYGIELCYECHLRETTSYWIGKFRNSGGKRTLDAYERMRGGSHV